MREEEKGAINKRRRGREEVGRTWEEWRWSKMAENGRRKRVEK